MPEPDVRAIHLAPAEGVTVKNPLGGPLTFKLRGEQTNGTLAAFESIAGPGEGPPLHVHGNADEVWYALEGTRDRPRPRAVWPLARRARQGTSCRPTPARSRSRAG